MGLFNDWAPNYIERGYSVIPVIMNLKRPILSDWSRFCDQVPTDEDLDKWGKNAKMSGGNIGLCLGPASGVMAIDFDYKLSDAKQVESMILGILPPIVVAKKGAKGWTAFFKYNPGIQSQRIDKSFEGSKPDRLVDVLSVGCQTVIPPSIHPDTGEPYFWTTPDTLEDIDKDDLPEITPDMIEAIREIAKIHKNEEYQQLGASKAVGRHDAVFGYVIRRISQYEDIESMVEDMIAFDLARHKHDKKGPYFQDESYLKGKSPMAFATQLAGRIVGWKKKKSEVSGGDPWDFGQDSQWPSKQNGFFSVWVSEDGKKKKYYPNHEDMANYFRDALHFKNDDSQMFIWEDGHYKSLSKLGLESKILELTKGRGQPKHIAEFYKYIRPHCFHSGVEDDPPKNKINLVNGVLDLKTKKLQSSQPDTFFKYRLPHAYESTAKCDRWLEFLDGVFLGDQQLIDVSAEMFGYFMSGGDPWLHKAFFLYGEGRNGKSTFLEVLETLLGSQNVCNIPIENLGKPFSMVMSQGKLANVVGEMTRKEIESSAFKTAVGGEHFIAAQKGMPEFRLRFKPKMVFACNHLPVLKDSSSGAYEKIYILPFKRYFTEEERIPNFAENHLFPEIPGIINWALDGYRRLLERGRLPKVDAVLEEFTEYRKESDSVVAWFMDECLLEKEAMGSKLYLKDIHIFYQSWCETHQVRPISRLAFIKRLAHLLRRAYSLGKIGGGKVDVRGPKGDGNFGVGKDRKGSFTLHMSRRVSANPFGTAVFWTKETRH